LFIFSSGSG
jgi:hypothetical protein